MKTATDSIAVIRTRLPYLDRRALSEAWFSALHLAREGRLAMPQRRSGDPGVAQTVAASRRASASGAARTSVPPPGGARLEKHARASDAAELASQRESRAQRARTASAVPPGPIPPPLNASFALTIDGARVQLLVRRDGPTLRITAICAAANVESVRRALASADVAMRLRGHVVESQVRAAGGREART